MRPLKTAIPSSSEESSFGARSLASARDDKRDALRHMGPPEW